MSTSGRQEPAVNDTSHGSFMSYLNGFILSLYLTVTAYLLVVHRLLARRALVGVVVGLALLQFIVQLFFFLHLGKDAKPRWKVLVFLFMLLVVSILVFGSLWIMANLNYHHLQSPAQVNSYLHGQDGI